MTPIGHAGIALILGEVFSKIAPSLDKPTILTSTLVGGIALDIDLLYRFYQKGRKVFDKTIGKHRYFPTHTPFFSLLITFPILLINFYFGLFFFTGSLIHLLLDTLYFPEGINFTYPLNKKTINLLQIKAHSFWAPKPISQVEGWWKNYFSSPLFWLTEVIPFLAAIVILLQIV